MNGGVRTSLALLEGRKGEEFLAAVRDLDSRSDARK
jgi:hypothetical protein